MHLFDSNGWANIHSAAYKGYNSSLEKFILADTEKLELRTNDELRSTPLLLAAMSGNVTTVELLFSLGSQIHTRNSQGHGIIEIACLKRDTKMIRYLLTNEKVREFDLPIPKQMVDFLNCPEDEWSIRTAGCLCNLVQDPSRDEPMTADEIQIGRELMSKMVEEKLVTSIIRVLRGQQGMQCKKHILLVFQLVMFDPDVCEDFVNQDGLQLTLALLKPPSTSDVTLEAIKVFQHLIIAYAEKIFNTGILVDLNRILNWATLDLNQVLLEKRHNKTGYGDYYDQNYLSTDDTDEENLTKDIEKEVEKEKLKNEWYNKDLLRELVKFVGDFGEIHQTYQNSIGREPQFLLRLKKLIYPILDRGLLVALLTTITKVATNNPSNQTIFMDLDIDDLIVPIVRGKDKQLPLLAVEAIHQLCLSNKKYCENLLIKDTHKAILLMLSRGGRIVSINESCSTALWALAGESRLKKAEMANYISVNKLIEFLQTTSVTLQLIGSEGLCVLSAGPISQRDVIGQRNGIAPLVSLLSTSNNHQIVLSCIRSIRQVCVRTGYLPHIRNQQLVVLTRGLRTLVALMRYCGHGEENDDDELIQVEAAYTAACVTMRNPEALAELHTNPKFNYIYILEKMYSKRQIVRLLAGSALAAFAYNNITEQKQIAMCGGVRYGCLRPFLDASDEQERCMSAFQMIVLARVIPDEELAISTAIALRTLISTLKSTENPDVQELGCDCVARLCHTRAGISNGMMELGIVDVLGRLILSYTESVRGSAAIALQYLSHFPETRRQILRKCRRDPYLMKAVQFYNSPDTIDTQFVEGWRHYRKVGLPKIEKSRPPLSTRTDIDLFYGYDTRQYTILEDSTGLKDYPTATSNQSSFMDKQHVPISSNYQVLPQISERKSEYSDENGNETMNGYGRNESEDMIGLPDKNSDFEETKLSLTAET